MKKKVILSSILTIALCLSVIAGATFALFTSESVVNIAVTAGNVNVVATADGLITSSMGKTMDEGKFENGGSAVVNANTITIDKITPGDKVTFNVKVTNKSDVTIQYRTIVDCIADTGLLSGLVITIDDKTFDGFACTDWVEMAPSADAEVPFKTITVSVELPKEAGNEFQGKSATLSYIVEAIQGNGDTYNGLQMDGETYLINNATDLKNFSSMVRNGKTFVGETVKLNADIDLQGKAFIAIGTNKNPFKGTFDGNNKTVKNFTVTNTNGAGLFGYATFEGDQFAEIKDVNVDNAKIVSNHYAGVIAGYCYGTITGCKVTNSTVTLTPDGEEGAYDNGDKAGAIVGYAACPVLTNNTVDKVTISAYRDLGGIAGHATGDGKKNAEISGNNVTNSTLVYDASGKTYDKAQSNAGAIVGRFDPDYPIATYTNNTYSNVKVPSGGTIMADTEWAKSIENDEDKILEIKTAEQLFAFAQVVNEETSLEGYTVKLIANIDLNNAAWTPINYFKGTFNGNNYTISNLAVEANKYAGLFGYLKDSGATITNMIIDRANVTAITTDTDGYAGAVIGYHYSSGGKVYVSNVTVTNSTIVGKNGGAIAGATSGTYVSDCTSKNNTITASRNGGIIGKTLEFGEVTGCTVSGNTQNIQIFSDESYVWVGTIVGQVGGDSTVEGNETTKTTVAEVAGQDAFEAAIESGTTMIYLESGIYELADVDANALETTSIIGNGAATLVVTNTADINKINAEVKGVTIDAKDTAATFVIGSNAILENVTFTNMNTNGSVRSIEIAAGSTVKNLVIENSKFKDEVATPFGAIYSANANAEVTIRNCDFVDCKYAVYGSTPMAKLTIQDCSFANISSWVVLLNGGDTVGAQLTITDCTFDNCTGGIAKYLGSSQPEGAVTVFTNNTLTNCAGHDGSDTKWFAIPGASSTITVSGNTLNGAEWIPGTAQGLSK